jgi:hypothetical protein
VTSCQKFVIISWGYKFGTWSINLEHPPGTSTWNFHLEHPPGIKEVPGRVRPDAVDRKRRRRRRRRRKRKLLT